jgi:hypothetical protein
MQHRIACPRRFRFAGLLTRASFLVTISSLDISILVRVEPGPRRCGARTDTG